MNRIMMFFVILGALALAFGVFFFRNGSSGAIVEDPELQYGRRKAWRYLFVFVLLLVGVWWVATSGWAPA